MAFVAWQAFARRSAALALIAIGFACQWISWARIDRAAFQYHYYTSLPFVLLGLAYFLAELWHGASRRTWLLARLAGAAPRSSPRSSSGSSIGRCARSSASTDVNPGLAGLPDAHPGLRPDGRAAGDRDRRRGRAC